MATNLNLPIAANWRGLLHVNLICRPVASLENVTKSFQLLIVAHRYDVTVVSFIHFTLFGRSMHKLLRHDDAPMAYPALKSSRLTPAVTTGIASHQSIKQLGSLRVRMLLKPVQYLAPLPLE